MNVTERDFKKRDQAFTLLEVMIAVSIFGLLLMYASEFLRTEIRTFDSASKQNDLQTKARVAMMHIVDEARLELTFYNPEDHSIYRYKDENYAAIKKRADATPLVYISLQPLTDTDKDTDTDTPWIFFDNTKGELWDIRDKNSYLIADQILELKIEKEPPLEDNSSLVKIMIKTGRYNGSESYELITWVRLD